ncbi:MBG domain-containing protein [Aliarcobacter cryaerophilus]|uniref:MBG domain-containing protein n=1 Tax=Aliarcobacter cryaerophilus TaxID=28198 RepID=UPI00112F0CA5|nr:MBG domain-containing protein [Aliarcobacter cryaerophilus]
MQLLQQIVIVKVYNGLIQNVSGFTVTGLVNNEDKSVLTGITGDNASGKDVGVYNTALAGTDTNYNLTFNQGSLEITKADATITANSDSKVYNGLIQNVSGFTVTGLVNNEDKSVLTGITGDNASGKDVGVYNTALAGTDTNYNLTFEDGKLTITKADLTATLNDNSKTYDGTSYSGGNGITFNGFVNGETASVLGGTLVYSGTSQGAKDAGNYIISGSGLTSNNYNISFVDGKLTINKKDLTISNITANNKTYDGTTTATLGNIGTLVGLVAGEDLVLNNPTSVIFSSKDVGDNIDVTASGYTIADKDSFKASNYN